MTTIDFNFRNLILGNDIGNTLAYCYQCATCSGACPVAQVTQGKYNPRRIILDALLGLKEKIFGPENVFNIWGCTVCDTCDTVCPQSIEVTEIITLAKNVTSGAGLAPDNIVGQTKTVFENGKAIPSQPAIERRREELGLPAVAAPDVIEVQTLLKNIGVDKKL